MLVDSHCHINFPEFEDDFAQILSRAKDANVGILQLICTKFSQMPQIIGIIEQYHHIYASVGLHPCNVIEEADATIKELLEFAKHPKINSLGETGLDFYRQNSNKTRQIDNFITHIEAARMLDMPVIIHTREADLETIQVLEQETKKAPFKILIHCFTASEHLAKKVIDLGGYISISGIVTFKNATDLQNIVKKLPLERLLVETDAPYLAPEPHRGKRNEPAFVKHTAMFLANLLEADYQLVEQQTTDNYCKLFMTN
jgi:TatD DNase family protein